MALFASKEKNTSPCKPSSAEQLDKMLRVLLEGGTADLKHFVFLSDFQEILWVNVRHLRITSDYNVMSKLGFSMDSGPQGFYLNSDGSWLLIAARTQKLEAYVSRCSDELESLWITNTRISALSGLRSLTGLTSLDLSWCGSLSELPGLGSMTGLTSLNLSGCRSLTELLGLGNLTRLSSLSLKGCSALKALPTLGNLIQLTSLDLSGCRALRALPALGVLPQLTSLSLNGCSSLTELDLSECRSLTKLSGLGSLSRLVTLNLDRCSSLTELLELEKLTQLTSLNLSGCSSLIKLSALEKMSRLTSLSLNGCSSLIELELSDCRSLTELPGLGNLTQLTSLHLSDCRSLTKLPGLENLTQLTSLDLSYCKSLTVLPGLGNLTQLTTLDLSGCSFLTELPAELRHMESLRALNLKHLKLRELPDWLPEIAESFSLLHFDQNSGKSKAVVCLYATRVDTIPDMSIFEQPYEVVAEFFRNRALGRTHPLNEIKVVFLGDGEAGKTHTIARLMNDGGEPDHAIFDGESTPGIVIRNKDYTVDDRTFRVHYWDFGGQEIMHSMHRIFLTGRTMYVILLNARDDTQSDRAKYWLHNVKSFAPDAPVLLVLNKIDQNENASVDEPDLRSRYSKLTQIVRLSALKYSQEAFNSTFTDVLLEEIQKTGYLDAQWPISWTQVKEQLENMTSHYIMGDEYQEICAGCRVDRNRKELLHWFNDLGVSFCFCDDDTDYALEDYVILRPDWITNALYIILFNRLEGAHNGLIPHRSIYQLLKNAHRNPDIRCTMPQARYNAGDIQYVLGIMRKFNLSFTDGNENEFIPMLCQQNSTVDVQYYRRDAETLEFNMEFDYLPNNLLHRLMVERHPELDMTKVWRTGARFTLPELGYSAVVVIDSNTLCFYIRHADPMHRSNTYLTMLKGHVERIVAKMGLKAPTCKLIYKLDGKRDEFDYEDVKLNLELGDTTMTSKAHRRKLLIADILNQSAPDRLQDETKLLDAIRRSCRRIQDEPVYRLIRKEGGTGHVNGKGMEDLRNRRIRDDLIMGGYTVGDQSQRGSSGTGRSVGEPDLIVFGESHEPWTIIEALRISDGARSDWNGHLDKLLGNYNSRGLPLLYLLTYVDADPGSFDLIWQSYQQHIRKYHPGQHMYCEGSFVELHDPFSPQYIKTAKCRYSCGGDSTTVYHIFAQISPRNG